MINVQELASCEPRDCDRGTESTDVSDSDDGTLSITTNHGFAEKSKELTILSDGRLQVVEHTHFTDNSGRPDYDSTHYFRRATNDETKDESKPKDGAKSKTEPKPKTETKSKAATPSASASKASASEEVETAVRGHYKAIGAGDFEKAYSYFGPNLRGKIDEAEWVANERSNQIRGSTINSVRVEGVSGNTATATVDVSFRDKTGTPRFVLTWNLVQEGGGWKLDSQQSGQKVN